MAKEESIFDAADVSEEAPTETPDMDNDPAEVNTEWVPMISKESPKDRKERLGEKKEMNKKVLTIKSYFFTKPKLINYDGSKILPKQTLESKKDYYPGKLGIRFVEDNLVEYYPNFHYFINDEGKVSNFAKINREGDNSVSNIFRLVLAKLKKPVDEVSDQEVFEFLVGKKVMIETKTGTYLGKKWFRNDIVGFV